MPLRTTAELSRQAWTVTLFSVLICLVGLAQVAVCVWLYVYSTGFAPVIGDPMRNVIIGYVALGSFALITSATGSCCALCRNKIGLLLYAGFLAASMVCQAGLWTFIYLEERQVSMTEGLQETIMKNSNTIGHVLNDEFHCRLKQHSNDITELSFCGNIISEWLNTMVTVLWSFSAALICIQFVTLIMAAMLRQMVSEVLRRNRVVDFYDAEVINHSRSQQGCTDRNHIHLELGHIQSNCSCHTQQGPVYKTTISL